MAVNYTRVLARNVLITFLAFTLVFAVAALFLYNNISKKLIGISALASNIELEQKKPERVVLLLQQAENDFQQSLLDTGKKNNSAYSVKLSKAFDEVDALINDSNNTYVDVEQTNKIKQWRQKRKGLSEEFFLLKHEFDSLLSVYADYSHVSGVTLTEPDLSLPLVKIGQIDTVQKIIPAEKRNFFKRLKEAVLNKSSSTTTKVIEIRPKDLPTNILSSKKTENVYKDAYRKRFQQLKEQNEKVLNMQGKLISLNSYISSELKRINSSVQEINFSMSDALKTMAFKNYRETTELLNKVHLAALVLVLVFATLLIIFITQLNKSEQHLRKENERSVTMAQQKMDLLHQMSHEIRNPLNAIRSFLYVFGKTGLTKRQSGMLDSIKLSSDMLLQTLDDTLDAAKMENSQFQLNNEPFNPDLTLRKVMESMEYSAAKKRLGMEYYFEGDTETMVEGDSFRLNQILVNLLSNAIKYTSEGEIVVTARLNSEDNRLYVAVEDTGTGISEDQQAALFSKYYQTSSAKGQTGTGLGLFICKQLVELQGGKIGVKSLPGQGSIFNFYIPYRKAEHKPAVKQLADSQSILLSGLRILAVDDSELNLSFLKMMTREWNVKFHEASNGKQALDILSKNEINIVLTDIQMPEMNGYELLSAIKTLGKPFDKLPVIAVSGTSEPDSSAQLILKGFSGLVNKPIDRETLKKQLIWALNRQ
ncbi:hybrid sensor histidine kinase/response regulator [Pedobacter heparinus]|uniref:ATP-binding response regulator n=1 Tax=Pedobacter heparinus TaxID=984 RepID=UPI00292D11D7|nr:ATP-binding protein [Pedobacter heparinus]